MDETKKLKVGMILHKFAMGMCKEDFDKFKDDLGYLEHTITDLFKQLENYELKEKQEHEWDL